MVNSVLRIFAVKSTLRIKMLQEKETYRFTVVRQITLPDDTSAWILTLNGDDRYLLPAEFYENYPIVAGMPLDCRIDKINCSGRIYLEPRHPVYSEGKVIDLILNSTEAVTDQAGNTLHKMVVQGADGGKHTHLCLSAGSWPSGTKMQAEILQIRKGKLVLRIKDPESACTMVPGDAGEWIILETGSYRGEEVMAIEGEYGLRTYLSIKDYPFLNLTTGTRFTGTLVRLEPSGVPLVEPLHPVYKPGLVYPFRITGSTDLSEKGEEIQTILLVEDCYGNIIKVYPGQDSAHDLLLRNKDLNCMVLRLKKGRPVLRIVNEPEVIVSQTE